MSASQNGFEPFVLGIEGQTFVGKTTLCGVLSRRWRWELVPEYADLGELPDVPYTDAASASVAASHLIEMEIDRKSRYGGGVRPTVLDRTMLSVVTMHLVHRALGLPSADTLLASRLKDERLLHAVFQPDAIVYLSVPYEEAVRREQLRGPMVSFLMDRRVRDSMEDAYRDVFSSAGLPVLFVDGTQDPFSIVDKIGRWCGRIQDAVV